MSEWPRKQDASGMWNLWRIFGQEASRSIGMRADGADDGVKGLLLEQLCSFLNHFDL